VSAAERGRTIAPGGAIVRFLSRVGTLETSSAIDRPRGAIVRFLSRFRALEESSANDRPGVVNVRTAEEENDCCRAEYETCKENQFFEKLKYENKHK
jgi:hypothetical protein